MMNVQNKNRLILLGLFGIFLLPIIAAVVLQSRWVDWQPPAVKQSGELLQPVVPLPPEVVERLAATSEQWTLVHVEPAGCDQVCIERLALSDHLQQLLGREQDKLHRVLATAGDWDAPPEAGATVDQLKTKLRAVNDQQSVTWLRGQIASDGGLLLIDPLGNAMMRYPADFDPVGLRADLARLLKKSKFLAPQDEPS